MYYYSIHKFFVIVLILTQQTIPKFKKPANTISILSHQADHVYRISIY